MTVSYALEQQVAIITFDDGKANVYSHNVLVQLASALDRAQADPEARSVLIVGAARALLGRLRPARDDRQPRGMRSLVAAGGPFMARLLLEPLPSLPPAPDMPWPRAPWSARRRPSRRDRRRVEDRAQRGRHRDEAARMGRRARRGTACPRPRSTG